MTEYCISSLIVSLNFFINTLKIPINILKISLSIEHNNLSNCGIFQDFTINICRILTIIALA